MLSHCWSAVLQLLAVAPSTARIRAKPFSLQAQAISETHFPWRNLGTMPNAGPCCGAVQQLGCVCGAGHGFGAHVRHIGAIAPARGQLKPRRVTSSCILLLLLLLLLLLPLLPPGMAWRYSPRSFAAGVPFHHRQFARRLLVMLSPTSPDDTEDARREDGPRKCRSAEVGEDEALRGGGGGLRGFGRGSLPTQPRFQRTRQITLKAVR